MVKVCDAIMGTGKSSAAITYLNSHPEDKFIYITPYLDEAARIKKGCPDLHFVEPSNKLKEYDFKKTIHTAALIKEGRNITTTHQAFKHYTQDTLDMIKQMGYTLIIDESVDVLETCNYHPDDMKMAVDAGYIKEDNGTYTLVNREYHGTAMSELFTFLKSRDLFRMDVKNQDALFFWVLPPDLFLSFKDVYILTYMFEGQSLHHFLKIYDIPYEYIGINKIDDITYEFTDYPGYVPDYVYYLSDKLHILEHERLNSIGDDYHALSMNWFNKECNTEALKNNVGNYYRHLWQDVPANRKLWGTYNGAYEKVKGKGYSKSFLTFNAKATNDFRHRDCLVYIVNIFMNVNEKTFYQSHGIEVDEDIYALSIMVQWIWRSAIRDGNDVYLYIPSRRMRTLLVSWMESFRKGGMPAET